MREITLDGKSVRVRANPLALLFYRQEFNSDLLGDWTKFERGLSDPTQYDALIYMQVVWALAKADKPKNFPSFTKWAESLETWDVTDPTILVPVAEEIRSSFFRWHAEHAAKKPNDV